jgi:hypothetical protein
MSNKFASPDSGAETYSTPHPSLIARVGLLLVLAFGLLLIPVQPGAAQESSDSTGSSNPICQDSSGTLADMIEGFVQITTALGVMGLLLVWQADSLMEMLTLDREQKAKIKQHKRGAMRSAGVLIVLGPLFTVAGSTMGLPIAQCVNLIPF